MDEYYQHAKKPYTKVIAVISLLVIWVSKIVVEKYQNSSWFWSVERVDLEGT